jgi:hypothetical protein
MTTFRLILASLAVLCLQVGLASAADPQKQKGLPPGELKLEEVSPQMPPPDVLRSGANCFCCCDCCCPPQGQVVAGVGLYLIQPFFESNPAYIAVHESGAKGSKRSQADRVDLAHDMGVAPLFWLGYMGESGLGARARWWYFRQGTDQTLVSPPSPANSNFVIISAAPLGIQVFSNTDQGLSTAFAVTSNLQLQVADLEAFQNLQAGQWDFLLAGGLRLAHINQHYNVFSGDSNGEAALWRTILSGHSFHGAGPVLAVEARRPLGGTGLSLYGNARGSLLFGSATQSSQFLANALRNDDANPSVVSDHRNRVIPVAELEAGLEYRVAVGVAEWFGQVTLVGQDWLGAGNASRSANFAFPGGFPVGGTGEDNDIGFLGLGLRFGVNY